MRIGIIMLLLLGSSELWANNYFHPTWSPNGDQVAFYGYINGVPDVFLLDINNGDIQAVTETADNWEIEPRWMDDQTLVVASGANMRKIRMTQLDIPSGKQKEMTGHKEMELFIDTLPENRILVSWKKDGQFNIYAMDINGENAQAVSHYEDGLFGHQLTDNNTKILVTHSDDIYLMPLEGGDLQPLVTHPAKDTYPGLSPDGQTLAFVSERDGQVDLYLMDVASGEISRLTNDEALEYAPEWSPDGQHIAFSANNGKADIYTYSLENQRFTNWTEKHQKQNTASEP